MQTSWLDQLIGFFSPRAKKNRMIDRYRTELIEKIHDKRKYDGAGSGRRFEGWYTSGSSANSEIERGIFNLRNRARDLRRNNPLACRGLQVITSNVVGRGIKTRLLSTSELRTKRARDLWNRWANTTACDFEGRKTLGQIQNLIMDSVAESGEVLVRLRRVIPDDKNPLPIQLQVLESDFLDSNLTNYSTKDGVSIMGIEFDSNGKRVSYRLYEEHPGSFNVTLKGSSYRTVRVPADQILHIYREDRPNQVRGVSWLAPIMMNLKDLHDYEDAQIVRQKLAACFMAFITQVDTGDKLGQEEIDLLEKLEPGAIELLGEGQEVQFASPPGVQNFQEFTSTIKHSIAAGLGISYESLTGDLSEVNFSSARMGFLEMNRNIETWRQNILLNQFLDPVVGWFLQAADLSGFNLGDITFKHIPPRREMIDPTKEIPAKIKSVRAGFESLSDAILQSGEDPDEVFNQKALDNAMIDRLELILDSDPRKTGQSGVEQSSASLPDVSSEN